MKRLVAWLGAAFLPALIGAPFPAPAYYRQLRKPQWAPPPAVFGPVWTVLYALMGVAAWLVAARGGSASSSSLRLWGVQAALNAAWITVFFGLRAPGAAMAVILATWAAIAATTVAFLRRRPAAGLLMLPYLAWVSFASLLNYEIWRRNR
jgi:tryptophan-rich sensory protein